MTAVRDVPGLKSEIMLIPKWAFVIAAIFFTVIPVVFYTFVWRHAPGPMLPFQILMSVLPGTIFAFLTLMTGYVNKDAGTRGMNRTLWTLLVIFIPNAIGFILYFLLRSPVRVECPKCGTTVASHANFCPRCGYSFQPTCPQCRSTVRPEDKFCPNCGRQIDDVA
jgi:RNA polymerase subunit RPABC4/transcription elongation factor Spt4